MRLEKKRSSPEMRPKATANIWNNIPPELGSIYPKIDRSPRNPATVITITFCILLTTCIHISQKSDILGWKSTQQGKDKQK
jgi:hypothetical protein